MLRTCNIVRHKVADGLLVPVPLALELKGYAFVMSDPPTNQGFESLLSVASMPSCYESCLVAPSLCCSIVWV